MSSSETTSPTTNSGHLLTSLVPSDSAPDNSITDSSSYDLDNLPDSLGKHKRRAATTLRRALGYDSRRLDNLHFVDAETCVYAAGFTVVFFDVRQGRPTGKYLSSLGGGGIGAIAVDSERRFIAVAEQRASRSTPPFIFVYALPQCNLVKILRGGADERFSALRFSPSGEKLASVAGAPDFMLTVWDWHAERIVLRSKAFSQDVLRVTFSPDNEGQLTTSGVGHIRFWRMANTFTGLKLHGQIGRFGRTELSDIVGYVELPDGKVLSGSEWGNLLLWEDGLIKCELIRAQGIPCHRGAIHAVLLDDGELITAGDDGYVRVWDFDTVDRAEVTLSEAGPGELFDKDDAAGATGATIIKEMGEVRVGTRVRIRSLVRAIPSTSEQASSLYYAQDANGAIWLLDLSLSAKASAPRPMASFHAGAILACAVPHHPSASLPLFASTGDDGSLRIDDQVVVSSSPQRPSILHFPSAGTALEWAPISLDPSQSLLIAGFADGCIRLIQHHPAQSTRLVAVHKAHSGGPITALAVSPVAPHTIVTAGSSDGRLFFFTPTVARDSITLTPLAYVQLVAPNTSITSLAWSPDSPTLLVACCSDGPMRLVDVVSPVTPVHDNSFETHLPVRSVSLSSSSPFAFVLHPQQRAQLAAMREREEAQRKVREAEEEERRKEDEQRELLENALGPSQSSETRRRQRSSAMVLNEQQKENGTKGEEQREETANEAEQRMLTQSAVPLRVLFSSQGHTMFVCVDGSHAHTVYEVSLELETLTVTPMRHMTLERVDDAAVSLALRPTDQSLCVGTASGALALFASTSNAVTDVCWTLPCVHYSPALSCSSVTAFLPSANGALLISVGRNGNVFVLEHPFQTEVGDNASAPDALPSPVCVAHAVSDIEDSEAYTLEESRLKAQLDRERQTVEQRQQDTRLLVKQLRRQFQKVLERNQQVAPHHPVPLLSAAELMVDSHIDVEAERRRARALARLEAEMEPVVVRAQSALSTLERAYASEIERVPVLVRSFCNASQLYVSTLGSVRHAAQSTQHDDMNGELEAKGRFGGVEDKPKDHRHETSDMVTPLGGTGTASAGAGHMPRVGGSFSNIGYGGAGGARLRRLSLASAGGSSSTTTTTTAIGRRMMLSDSGAARRMSQSHEMRRERDVRDGEWRAFNARRPTGKEDPNDVAAIALALDTIGDYKLKTAPDYEVPPEKQVNAASKRRELAALRLSMESAEQRFNRDVLTLRGEKRTLLRQLAEDRAQIAKLNVTLELDASEEPERLKEFTREQMDAFRVREGKRRSERKKAKKAMEKEKDESDGGAFGFVAQGMATEKTKSAVEVSKVHEEVGKGEEAEDMSGAQDDGLALSAFEEAQRRRERVASEYVRDVCEARARQSCDAFDAKVRAMRVRQLALDGERHRSELRRLLLEEELTLLQEFEKREGVLVEKEERCVRERREMEGRVRACEARLGEQENLVEAFEVVVEQMNGERFEALVPEGHACAGALERLYRKKGKTLKKKRKEEEERKRRGANEGGGEEEDEEDLSDLSDLSDFSDLDDDEDEKEEKEGGDEPGRATLVDCDEDLQRDVLRLRNERWESEEGLVEARRTLEGIRKELEGLRKRQKVVDGAMKAAEQETRVFQGEKQRRLNELMADVAVKRSQVECDVATVLSPERDALVIRRATLQRLEERIGELKEETEAQRQAFREIRQLHVTLTRSLERRRDERRELEEKSREMQRMTFGCVVRDVDRVLALTVNHAVEDAKEALIDADETRGRELLELERELLACRDEYGRAVTESTVLLERYADLMQERCVLERNLNRGEKVKLESINAIHAGPTKKVKDDERQLRERMETQQRTLEELHREIGLLKRKSGPAPPLPMY